MTDERDEELGRALRSLPAPPHGPGFADDLHALLEDAAAERRARQRRRRFATRLAPALVAAAAGVAVLVGLPGDETHGPIGPAPAKAADVVDKARAALARVHSLQATLTVRTRIDAGEPISTERLKIAQTDKGDLRILGSKSSGDFYYSAAKAREVQLHLPYAPGAFVTENVAPGPPDGFIGDRTLGLQSAEVVRALTAARTGRLEQGRAVYTLEATIPVNKLGFSGDHLTITIDRVSGFPLSVEETLKGKLVRGFALTDLRLDAKAVSYEPKIPAGAARVDNGFKPGKPDLTVKLPAGFEQAETRTAETAQPTGNEGLNPPSRDVTSTAYRRGLDTVIVSTRATDGQQWADPVAPGEGNQVTEERVKLPSGETARLVLDPRVEPHVWIRTAKQVITITGPLTREELLTAARSLR